NLGWTLLATDAYGDGRNDLVIRSPIAPGGGNQRGIVATFYSHPSRNDKEFLTLEEADWKAQSFLFKVLV
ncbi:hypothetical protein NP569_26135, partial [Vibrio parahaemolyticus]|nr:hypothetical protein [Vibrio parahaemolyticus]